MNKMDPAVKAKWVVALRSGDYNQCTNRLRSEDDKGYCCLGVLAEEMGWLDAHGFCTPLEGEHRNNAVITPGRGASVGLEIAAQDMLTQMNDRTFDRQDFDQIARWIEVNL